MPLTQLKQILQRLPSALKVSILKAAEIEKLDPLGRKLTAYSFRHTFATMMAESVGHSPFIVKQILGHSQITTTDRYCHPTAQARIIDLSEIFEIESGVSGGIDVRDAAGMM